MISYLNPQASTFAPDIDWLFTFIFFVVGFWFLLAQGAFFYFIYRFRRREGVPGQYVPGETKEEKRWISVPHMLVILCDVGLIAATIVVWMDVKQKDLSLAQEKVRVVAQQWAWTFVHPGPDGKLDTADDITKVNELHVKSGTMYEFELTSKDVLHSFAIPSFRLKQDAVPGRTIRGWFEPTTPGNYDVQCAEICGIGHALMPARVTVETPEQHQQWMQQERA